MRTKENFDHARKEFQARLKLVQTRQSEHKSKKRAIAEKTGAPQQYLDYARISTKPDGSVNIYFGGASEPLGPEHGHYTMDRYDTVTYRGEPYDPHGVHNFTDEEAYIKYQVQQGHNGGFGYPLHGWIEGSPVTAAYGWGANKGHTLLADGHVDLSTFEHHGNHNHDGPGDGKNENVMERHRCSGPGS